MKNFFGAFIIALCAFSVSGGPAESNVKREENFKPAQTGQFTFKMQNISDC
jgi:hypothetical protein